MRFFSSTLPHFGSRQFAHDHKEHFQLSKNLPIDLDHMALFEPQRTVVIPPPFASSDSDATVKPVPSSKSASEDVPDTSVLSSSRMYSIGNISILESNPPLSVQAETNSQAATYAALAGCNHSQRSMTLALFTPSHVSVGAVGYYAKSSGKFITLFNAQRSFRLPSGASIPPLQAYGDFELQYLPHRNKTNKFAVPLVAGEKKAYAFAKSTIYAHIDNPTVAAEWLKAHVDVIMEECGSEFGIEREELSIVTGTVNALEYALFLSQEHHEGLMFFDVYPERVAGMPWGEFRMTCLRESAAATDFTAKVSRVRCKDERRGCADCGDSLLLAPLRIRRGETEPTFL